MVVVTFRNYDKNNKLDMFNKQLAKVSKDRFELRQNKRGNYYLYDYDFREITTSKKEIKDIIECMNLEREFKDLEVEKMNKKELYDILEDLLQECENDLFEYEDIEEEKAKMIYKNVRLFVAKLKDKIEDLEV